MAIQFHVLPQKEFINTELRGAAQLVPENWDDYSFETQFALHYIDASGRHVELGAVKIGCKGQKVGRTAEAWTRQQKVDARRRPRMSELLGAGQPPVADLLDWKQWEGA